MFFSYKHFKNFTKKHFLGHNFNLRRPFFVSLENIEFHIEKTVTLSSWQKFAMTTDGQKVMLSDKVAKKCFKTSI